MVVEKGLVKTEQMQSLLSRVTLLF